MSDPSVELAEFELQRLQQEQGEQDAPEEKPNIHIAGVPVHFPHKPYRAQVALMNAVVNAVRKRDHALVESPTGTGKSLALLCSSLAVQQRLVDDAVKDAQRRIAEEKKENERKLLLAEEERQKEKQQKQKQKQQQDDDDEQNLKQLKKSNTESKEEIQQQQPQDAKKESTKAEQHSVAKSEAKIENLTLNGHTQSPLPYSNHVIARERDSDDDDFQRPARESVPDVSWQLPQMKQSKKRVKKEELPENAFMVQQMNRRDRPLDEVSLNADDLLSEYMQGEDEQTQQTQRAEEKEKRESRRIPRIFFATRTHTQVTQIIRELRKTLYKPSMCILASRREYCINEDVYNEHNRDDICKKLVANNNSKQELAEQVMNRRSKTKPMCKYFSKSGDLVQNEQVKQSKIWDIEEIKGIGNRINACPYFASHDFYQTAKLILCPYSYLIDPIIKRVKGINLKNDIVIFDEAHNIENYSREAASFKGDVALFSQSLDELNKFILYIRNMKNHISQDSGNLKFLFQQLLESYKSLKLFVTCIVNMIDSIVHNHQFQYTDNYQNITFERNELTNILIGSGINHSEIAHWKAAHEYILEFGDGNEEERYLQSNARDRPVINFNEEEDDDEDNVRNPSNNANNNSGTNSNNAGASGVSNGYGYGGGGGDNANTDGSGTREVKRGRFSKKVQSKRNWKKGAVNNYISSNYENSQDDIEERGVRNRAKMKAVDPYLGKSVNLCNSLLTTLDYVFKHPNDFTLILDRKSENFETVTTLSFQCLNAGICFNEISSIARSVIVTSGTLSPMESFASELNTRFAISKSLPHVIDVQRQLYVGVVTQSPDHVNGNALNQVTLEATYHASAKFEFQDNLGYCIVDYCKVIPGGILIFFPSYRLMDVLTTRWKNNGIWNRLLDTKGGVFCEPAQRGEHFDSILAQYYKLTLPDEADASEEHEARANGEESSERNGAILMCVCRGKLSEGIDFKDEASRAVLLIGIPYPYLKDITVLQKKKWNDRKRQEYYQAMRQNATGIPNSGTQNNKDMVDHRQLKNNELQVLSGSEWYELQAFRALNQALGRTIRHRYDYGAILLIDARFRQHRVLKQLPQWSQQVVRSINQNHASIVNDLGQFFTNVHSHLARITKNGTSSQSQSQPANHAQSVPRRITGHEIAYMSGFITASQLMNESDDSRRHERQQRQDSESAEPSDEAFSTPPPSF